MEFSNLPPRADQIPFGAAETRNPAPGAPGTRAETLRPVMAAAKTDPDRAVPADDFQPLDTFEVGDNDHVPVPPEPPRQPAVLAAMAQPTGADTVPDHAATQASLTTSLRDLDDGPGNPTVDIRR